MPPSAEPTAALPPGVGRTALGVARIRAAESARPDRLFDDPFAQAFVDAGGEQPGDGQASALARWLAFYTTVRTRYYDDYLLAAAAAGCRQVVLVAAGLDARAYRLDWPDGVRVFELDLPEVLAFKQSVLDGAGARPRCGRTAVGVDLRADWPASLLDAGLDPRGPVAWLVEGLLVYLSAAEAAGLLERLTGLSPEGSRLACEVQGASGPGSATGPAPSTALPGYTELWQGGLGDRLPDHLRSLGWDVAVQDRSLVAAGYGRFGPPSRGTGFCTALRSAS